MEQAQDSAQLANREPVREPAREPAQEPTTWWSKAILVGAVIALVMLPVAALGYRMHIWSLGGAFMLMGGAVVLSLFGVFGGVIGIVIALRRQLTSDKPVLYIGTLICALILAYAGMQFNTARSVPPIHDISTDVSDPPEFEKIIQLRGDQSNSLDYDASTLAPLQAQAYPWVTTLEVGFTAEESFDRALNVLRSMGLEIVNEDPDRGIIEAVDTSFWFGFKDDLVVRIRATGYGSKVDVRSVSRVGESDLGKNAQRIGKFLEAFEAAPA